MGSLAKSGKRGIYTMRYYDRTGRQREESTRTTDLEEATRILKNTEAAIANGAPVTPQIGKFTFEDGVKLIEQDYLLKNNDSWDHVARRIRIGLEPWFGRRRLASISSADISAYAEHRKKIGAAKNATINRELSALHRMFTLAVHAGKLLQIPGFPTLSEKGNARKGFFEPEAFEAVYRHLPVDHQRWARAAYVLGWRVRSEVLTLDWAHVDRDAELIRLDADQSKNEKGRVFAYGPFPELRAVLDACWTLHRELAREDRIVPQVFVRSAGKKRGEPIRSFRKAWLAACTDAGQPGRIPHDFRRTAVRNLIRYGVDRGIAKQMVGHRTDEMFERYAIVSEGDMLSGAAKLAAGLKAEAARIKARQRRDQRRDRRQVEVQVEVAKTGTEGRRSVSAKLRRVK